MFNLIAAIGKNRELGKNGKLVFHIPEDMRYFKKITTGHKVLMGRKTWESLPAKLPDRENIVISRNPNGAFFGARPASPSSRVSGASARRNSAPPSKGPISASSDAGVPDSVVSDLPAFIREYKDSGEEIFVIGGGMVYWEMMKYAKKLYLTEVDAEAEADTFFPEFDKNEWTRTVIKEGEDDGIKYAFVVYERK